MMELKEYEVWFITGSQHLYGDETLKQVASHAREIAGALDASDLIPVKIEFKEIVTSPDQVHQVFQEANQQKMCVGVMVWMHTFSPAKMWIHGLRILSKPLLHFHTQFNSEIPWDQIDMAFMNLNQSAHGDREFGFITSRLRARRKVVVGHWKEATVKEQLGNWTRAAAGWHCMQETKIARIGDNMREVAVTEGDKVEAQIRLGFSVNGYGLGELVQHINQIPEREIESLIEQYAEEYIMDNALLQSPSLKDAAQIELGLRAFLEQGGFHAFTDTFENLNGLKQLPGISVQRLMADGYGFGAEGDWKTAGLLRAFKVMSSGLSGGTSFMEDYTYDFGKGPSRVLSSHMLEICPSMASHKPRCEVHPLSIGGKEDPVRLIFEVDAGPAINVSLIDLGNRFRMVANEVQAVDPPHQLPKLPVARVLLEPSPNMEVAAQTWILAGGAHHTVFSKAISIPMVEDLAEIAGLELLIIDNETRIRSFKEKLRWNEVYFHLFQNNL